MSVLWLCTLAHWPDGPLSLVVACRLSTGVLRRGNPEAFPTGDTQGLARVINVLEHGLVAGSLQRRQLNRTLCNCSVEKGSRVVFFFPPRETRLKLSTHTCTGLPYLRSHAGMGLHSALIPTFVHLEGLSSVRLNRMSQLKCRMSFSLYSLASSRT